MNIGKPSRGEETESVPAIAFRLDPRSGVPTYLQLVHQVEHALRLGHLQKGDQLPRLKDVVASLSINPNTAVQKAYKDLEQKGIARGRPGQGTFIEASLERTARIVSSITPGMRPRKSSRCPPSATRPSITSDITTRAAERACFSVDSLTGADSGERSAAGSMLLPFSSRNTYLPRTLSVARPIFTSHDVVRVFCEAATRYGFPESVLSDNGVVYTASYKGGVGAMESELMSRGILFKHSRPYHPETNGKVEHFHQTMKKFLYQHDAPESVSELQSQIDTFVSYYNEVRPHRGIGRRTPRSIYETRVKARPSREPTTVEGYRIRHDKVNPEGKVTLRYRGELYHVGIGRRHRGEHVTLLVAGRDVRILDEHNRLIRALTIDPTRNYQALE